MRHPNEVITSRIRREELVGLLDAISPHEKQRITAPMPAVTPPPEDAGELDEDTIDAAFDAMVIDEPPAPAPQDVVVRFVRATGSSPRIEVPVAEPERPLPRWAIVVGSFGLTLLLGALVMAAA